VLQRQIAQVDRRDDPSRFAGLHSQLQAYKRCGLWVLYHASQTCRIVCAQQAHGQAFVSGLFHHPCHCRATQKVNPVLCIKASQQFTGFKDDRRALRQLPC
jgi:hypothetical protein